MGTEAAKPKSLSKAALEQLVHELENGQREIAVQMQDIRARVQVLEIAKPASLRAMSVEEIEVAIRDGAHGKVKFEVLEEWEWMGETFKAGRVLVAAQYRHLVPYVREQGLKLALPVDGGALEQAAVEAAARSEVARAITG